MTRTTRTRVAAVAPGPAEVLFRLINADHSLAIHTNRQWSPDASSSAGGRTAAVALFDPVGPPG